MASIEIFGMIPAEQTVGEGEPLNVLVMAINSAERPVSQRVGLYGRLEEHWRLLVEKVCAFQPMEHAHLYFQIPGDCFTPQFWGTAEPLEELALAAGTETPPDSEQGQLVFCQARSETE